MALPKMGGKKYIKIFAVVQADQTVQGMYLADTQEPRVHDWSEYVFFQESLKPTSYM